MAETPILRLPAGMRDHAPEAASARRRIVDGLLAMFERRGFARVITPAFEYEEVLALGLGTRRARRRSASSSRARARWSRCGPTSRRRSRASIATRYRDEPGPVRLCYEGTVVRLERAARGQRELMQAGVELAGVPGADGDAEAIALAVEALAAVGLPRPTIDLGHLGPRARGACRRWRFRTRRMDDARRCIAKHDGAGLAVVLKSARGSRAAIEFARLLPELSGAPAVLDDARAQAPNGGIKRALAELADIVAAVNSRKLDARLHVDLGEVRGFDYYTGVRFQAFVPGASDAVLRGGRYDGLLGRYGRPSPAVGFAVDVDAVAGALESTDTPPRAAPQRSNEKPRRARSKE